MSGKYWSGVDQRHVAALRAIAAEGSFRAAADQLGYVQSAVSDQIAHLERCVGMELVRRRNGSAAGLLTEPGERLLRHFELISTQFAAAEAEMAGLKEGRGGALRIGVLESVEERLLASTLVKLQRIEPGIEVEVIERRSAEELCRLVAGGEADAAIGTLPLGDGALRWRQLMRDPYVLLAPVDGQLARSPQPVALDALAGARLIGAEDSPATRLLEDELRAAGIEPEWVFRSGRHGVVRAMVAAGMGAALVPRSAAGEGDERTTVLELEPGLSPRTLIVYWRVDRSPDRDLDRFVELAADRAAWLRESRRPAPRVEAPAVIA